jgi:hypothetical protein
MVYVSFRNKDTKFLMYPIPQNPDIFHIVLSHNSG